MADNARQMKYHAVQVQQWLTDISATRGLDGLDDGFDEAAGGDQLRGVEEIRVAIQEMEREIEQNSTRASDSAELAREHAGLSTELKTISDNLALLVNG